jgi:hypothetical protein
MVRKLSVLAVTLLFTIGLAATPALADHHEGGEPPAAEGSDDGMEHGDGMHDHDAMEPKEDDAASEEAESEE